MRTQHLRRSGFTCIACDAQLVEVVVVTRETVGIGQISKTRTGLGCLVCGAQYDQHLRVVRRAVPYNPDEKNNSTIQRREPLPKALQM